MVKAERNIPTGLYVHIPFCVRKCDYCDFLSASASEKVRENYVNLLCEEIEREAVCYPDYRGTTVFFGGGTPTVLRPEQLGRILCKLKECFSVGSADVAWRGYVGDGESEAGTGPEYIESGEGAAGIASECIESGKRAARTAPEYIESLQEEPEITLECNPGTVTEEDLRRLREAGFNRLSIGLQSAQNAELRKLGRIHTWEDFQRTYESARKAGFRNINVDIMSALPGQSVESYVNSVERVIELSPEHISAYSLIIEEGTPFYERYGEADMQRQREGVDRLHLLPSEEEERRMYELTRKMLERKGYHRYEISNYALPGRECRHNITYWRRGDYLGFGLGAASLVGNCRFVKPEDLTEYGKMLQNSWKDRSDRKGGRDIALPEDDPAMEKTGFHDRKNGDNTVLPKDDPAMEKTNSYGQKDGQDIEPARERQSPPQDEGLHRNVQRLSRQEQMEEFMFLGLRLTEGISAGEFREYFHTAIEEVYGDVLRKLERQGLLVRAGDRIALTERGIDVSNVVLSEFLL